jgi:hypothetical protein
MEAALTDHVWTIRELLESLLRFDEMIGDTVLAIVPMIDGMIFQELKLHGAEAGGIWVECQHLTDLALKAIGASVGERTPIFFLPFAQITFAWRAIDQTSLSERSFGV